MIIIVCMYCIVLLATVQHPEFPHTSAGGGLGSSSAFGARKVSSGSLRPAWKNAHVVREIMDENNGIKRFLDQILYSFNIFKNNIARSCRAYLHPYNLVSQVMHPIPMWRLSYQQLG